VLAWAFATVMGAAILASAATIITGGAAAGAGPGAVIAANNGTSGNDITAPFLDRLFRPNYAALTGGTGQQAAGVFAGGRDLAADRDAARRMLLGLRDRPEIAADDRQYLAQMVAARTGLPKPRPSVGSPPSKPTCRPLSTTRAIAMHLSFCGRPMFPAPWRRLWLPPKAARRAAADPRL
jgi:hypothetical protein